MKKGLVCTEIRPRKAAGVLHTSLAAQKFYFESATEISNGNYLLKVIKFQNEFLKSSFLPKYKRKIGRIFVHIFRESMTS